MGRPMGFMIKEGVVFCAIVGKIVGTRSPEKPELALCFTEAEPVVLHVYGFDFTLDDGVISNHNCGGFITLDGRFGLRPTHIDKSLKNPDHFFWRR